MFDPTVYDNIKVVLEGEIYDLDLSGIVNILDRQDLVNLAIMTRKYIIRFGLMESTKDKFAEIHLFSEDLSKEIMELKDGITPGCDIIIKFIIQVTEPIVECKMIEDRLNRIWDYRPKILQVLSYEYKEEKNEHSIFNNEISLNFGRKIDEDNISDIHNLVNYTLRSLKVLNDI